MQHNIKLYQKKDDCYKLFNNRSIGTNRRSVNQSKNWSFIVALVTARTFDKFIFLENIDRFRTILSMQLIVIPRNISW